ncbi:MAG: histidine kinase [Planctomycetaceae bacterium]|nr:histidine kinase [Planctomycetaceae bacterium]
MAAAPHLRIRVRRQVSRFLLQCGWYGGAMIRGLVIGVILWSDAAAHADLWELLNPQLTATREQQAVARRQLEELGRMEMGVASERIGAQYHMAPTPPAVPPFVQVDLGRVCRFDTVVVVPAVSQFGGQGTSAYAFPAAFRVDASDDANFDTFTPLGLITETGLESRRSLPIVVRCAGTQARYLRVTIVQLAQVADRWTFALGEIMVLDGNYNVAVDASVRMRKAPRIPRRWHSDYLVDGRTTLGPPIVEELPEFDGAYATDDASGDRWMKLDLGQACSIREVRLHPIHARQGNSLPGYSFPQRFRVELRESEAGQPLAVFDSLSTEFSNPGNNPVVCRFEDVTARYVDIVCVEPSVEDPRRFGLSEVQVYSAGRNVAIDGSARLSGPPTERGPQMLIDQFTSYGRVLELPAWIDRWDRYRHASRTLEQAAAAQRKQMETAEARAVWLGGTGLLLVGLATGGASLIRRRREAAEKRRFRMRLARDLHDEIGSNLAAIARLGEVVTLESSDSQAQEDWQAVRQLALECTDSMRDTLWLLGGSRYDGGTLYERLQTTARRMLPHIALTWEASASLPPVAHDSELSRDLYLIFKEMMANVTRHARATEVTVRLQAGRETPVAGDRGGDGWLTIQVCDNGVGMEAGQSSGMGLGNIRQRTRRLNGHFSLHSVPGEGTHLSLQVPVRTS